MTAIEQAMGGAELFDLARRERRHLFNSERLQQAMADRGLDAVVALSPANLTYSTGAWISLPLLFSFALTDNSGRQAVVVNEADAYFLREYSWVEDIRSFRYGPDSARAALRECRDLISDLNLHRGTIGIELSSISLDLHELLVEHFPQVTWENATPVFEHARLIKTEGEIELFRAAALRTSEAIQTAFALSAPGHTEKRLATEMQMASLRLGADSLLHAHVHAGRHSTIVHALPLEEPMRPGEVIHVDFGACFAGYCTDISRNAIVGTATGPQTQRYRDLWNIHQLALDAVKPGVTAEEVFRTVQSEFEERGLIHPWGTLGHSTGLEIHEGFEISAGSDVELEPGMILNVEPSHIEKGDARYHLEDSVLVTDNGQEVLSGSSSTEDLFVIQ